MKKEVWFGLIIMALVVLAAFVLLPSPSEMTNGHIGLLMLALVVVAVLARRQIAQREEARKLAEVEFAAMLAERNRLARELHDTIAQELNAVSMQMELARNTAKTGTVEEVMRYLGTAHVLVRGCLAAARESIWDMRSHVLEKTDLLGALSSVAEQMSAGLGCTIHARAHGKSRRLAPMVENHLLRIGQEACSGLCFIGRRRTGKQQFVGRLHAHAQTQVGARVGVGQGGLGVDAAGLDQFQQHLVEGVHAHHAALFDRLPEFIHGALEDQVGHPPQIGAGRIAQVGQGLPGPARQTEQRRPIGIRLDIGRDHLLAQAHHFVVLAIQLERLRRVVVGQQQVATAFDQTQHRIVHIERDQAALDRPEGFAQR